MNFETEYKNIKFHISLEQENISDISLLMGDKFNRLPNQTMQEIRKGNLLSYNIVIISSQDDDEFTHYLSGVLLTSHSEDLIEELGEYLESEHVLDHILDLWKKYQVSPGPQWRTNT